MTRDELLQTMLMDEDALLEEVVGKAKSVFQIDRRSGDAVLLVPQSSLTHGQQIAVQLLGRYLSHQLGLVPTDALTTAVLASRVEPDEPSVAARLSELRRIGAVEAVERGEYRVVLVGVNRILDDILSRDRGAQTSKRSVSRRRTTSSGGRDEHAKTT